MSQADESGDLRAKARGLAVRSTKATGGNQVDTLLSRLSDERRAFDGAARQLR